MREIHPKISAPQIESDLQFRQAKDPSRLTCLKYPIGGLVFTGFKDTDAYIDRARSSITARYTESLI
jgi:hypothetical protein